MQGLDVNCPGRFVFSLAVFLVPAIIRYTHKIYNKHYHIDTGTVRTENIAIIRGNSVG